MPISSENHFSRFLKKNMAIISVVMFAAVIGSLLQVILPISIGRFTELAFQMNSNKSSILESIGIHIADLNTFYTLFGIIAFSRLMLGITERLAGSYIEDKLSRYYRENLFEAQISQLPNSFYSKSTSHYMVKYSGELSGIQNLLTKGIIKSTSDIIVLVFAFLLFGRINGDLTAVLAISCVALALIITLLSVYIGRASEAKKNQKLKLIVFIESRLNAWLTIKAFNRKTRELNSLRRREQSLNKTAFNFNILGALQHGLLSFGIYAIIGFILYSSVTQKEQQSASEVITFILLLLYLQSPLKRLLRVPSVLAVGKSSLISIHGLLNLPREDFDKTNLDFSIESITFREVKITEDSSPIHFHAALGSSIWINGLSDIDKNTLSNSLLAIEHVYRGKILLNDKPIEEITPFQLRKCCTIAGKNYPLLGKTVFESITYNAKESRRTEVMDLLIALGITANEKADEFLDMRLGPGNKLSTTIEFKLQMARAILTGKPIVIFHECFEGIPTQAQKDAILVLNSIQKDHIVLILSDKLPETVKPDITITHL